MIGIVGLKSSPEAPTIAPPIPVPAPGSGRPYKLASKEYGPEPTIVRVGDVTFGSDEFVVMAGPCAIESWSQLIDTARSVRKAGARVLRGGAYKPRSSPYSFQGLGPPGLQMLAEARAETWLPIITEVLEPGDVERVAKYADILQIGARNMQNFSLLKEVGKASRPVLLKRALSGTIEEWLLAAEYVMASGNLNVVLCERGIRTYETATRNTLDLSAVPAVKKLSHLPVVADPSHGTGKADLVPAMALASVAAGADALMIEVHPSPDHALSDGAQSLNLAQFADLVPRLAAVAEAIGRALHAGARLA